MACVHEAMARLRCLGRCAKFAWLLRMKRFERSFFNFLHASFGRAGFLTGFADDHLSCSNAPGLNAPLSVAKLHRCDTTEAPNYCSEPPTVAPAEIQFGNIYHTATIIAADERLVDAVS